MRKKNNEVEEVKRLANFLGLSLPVDGMIRIGNPVQPWHRYKSLPSEEIIHHTPNSSEFILVENIEH
ncbi:excinuclease ABC subunit UvrC [Sesbania bispinosa]|nr:excinuclease ABC subunit UvrC [Sesbania bispinosa]